MFAALDSSFGPFQASQRHGKASKQTQVPIVVGSSLHL